MATRSAPRYALARGCGARPCKVCVGTFSPASRSGAAATNRALPIASIRERKSSRRPTNRRSPGRSKRERPARVGAAFGGKVMPETSDIGELSNAISFLILVVRHRCAFARGGRFHPESWIALATDERFSQVTGWTEASRQRPPWAGYAGSRADGEAAIQPVPAALSHNRSVFSRCGGSRALHSQKLEASCGHQCCSARWFRLDRTNASRAFWPARLAGSQALLFRFGCLRLGRGARSSVGIQVWTDWRTEAALWRSSGVSHRIRSHASTTSPKASSARAILRQVKSRLAFTP